MRTVKILIFALFHILNYQNCDLEFLDSNGSCQIDYGKRGICARIEQCPGTRNLLKRGLFPEICRFDDLTPVVCCDQSAVLPSQLGIYRDIVNQNITGYSCQTSYGKQGVYLRIEQCSSTQELWKREILPDIYYFNGLPPLVCCEQNDELPSPQSQLGTYEDIATQNIGGYCQTGYGKQGICLSLGQCPSTQELMKRGIPPNICYFDGSTPIVCCEQSNTLPSPPSQFGKYGEISTQNINRNCQTNSGRQGTCLSIEQCPGSRDLLKRGMVPKICQYNDITPMVCCEHSDNDDTELKASGGTQNNADNGCQSGNGRRGLCLSIEQCPSAQQSLRRGSRPKICRFDGSIPIVCCEQSDNLPSPLAQSQSGRSGQIARQKCEEQTMESGRYVQPGAAIGGVDAARFEFPHMAVLGYGKDDDMHWICGGSLISKKFVMTAAHCIYSFYGNVRKVALGAYLISYLKNTQMFDVKNISIHQGYIFGQNYNDIALIELDRDARISFEVSPACLQTEKEPQDVGPVMAVGWGATELHGPPSDILQKVYLSLVTYANCSKYYKPGRVLPNGLDEGSQICADGGGKRRDTCQGDSGGPLQKYEKLRVTIIGVTSFGSKCAKVPGVYTRVSNYIPWIESIVWPN